MYDSMGGIIRRSAVANSRRDEAMKPRPFGDDGCNRVFIEPAIGRAGAFLPRIPCRGSLRRIHRSFNATNRANPSDYGNFCAWPNRQV
jgi:hypothetical protein